jgi:hypothetical protein
MPRQKEGFFCELHILPICVRNDLFIENRNDPDLVQAFLSQYY